MLREHQAAQSAVDGRKRPDPSSGANQASRNPDSGFTPRSRRVYRSRGMIAPSAQMGVVKSKTGRSLESTQTCATAHLPPIFGGEDGLRSLCWKTLKQESESSLRTYEAC